MKISIIIPSYNSKATILKTIDSIYDSTNMNKHSFDIMLIDDCSDDNSTQLVKKNYPTVRIIQLRKKSGASGARNKGIEEAKSDILLFLDADAYLNKTTIAELLSSLSREIDIVFPKINYEDGRLMYPILDIEKTYPHISCSFMMKKSSIEKLPYAFDESYMTYLEDYDFFMRCKLAGLKAKYAEQARVVHSIPKKKDYTQRYYFEVRNMVYGMRKLGKKAIASGLYNPFTKKALFKAFICGMKNIAWFDWHSYDRGNGGKKQFTKINEEGKLIPLFWKARKGGMKMKII